MTSSPDREPRALFQVGEHPADASSGSESSPVGGDARATAGVGERAAPGVAPPPGANQGKPEPMPLRDGRADPAAGGGRSIRLDRQQGTMGTGNPQVPRNAGLPAVPARDATGSRDGEDPDVPDTDVDASAARALPTAPPDPGHPPSRARVNPLQGSPLPAS